MNKIEQAREILSELKVPDKQQADLCCLTLLSMANIKPSDNWKNAENNWVRIHDVINYVRDHYNISYAENSRETFRKQAIHHFRNAAFIEDNGMATNSPNYRYRLTDEMLNLIKCYGSREWELEKIRFLEEHDNLINLYSSNRAMLKIPIIINEELYNFSPGMHNELQKAILEEFAPRFALNTECIYVGDTIKKDLVKNVKRLVELGFTITLHDKMPDVILYSKEKNWLYFIEAVTSVGPIDPKRIVEIESMTKDVVAEKIYVTAFPNFKTFKKFSEMLAWETEVWIADMPDHMIHLNGDKFLGPRDC